MKIVLATHFFPPTQAGGTESYTLGLAKALQARGHEPFVICAGSIDADHGWPPRAADDVWDGVPVRRLSWDWTRSPDPFTTFYDNPWADRLVQEYLAETGAEIVHVTSCYSLGAGVLRVAREAGCRVIFTPTDFWMLCVRHTLLTGQGELCAGPRSAEDCQRCMAGGSRTLGRLMQIVPETVVTRGLLAAASQPMLARLPGLRGYVGNADARLRFIREMFSFAHEVLAPSAFMKQMLAANGYPADAMSVSPYGHDLSWGPRPAPRPADGILRVGYLGQIEPLKGVHVAVEAVRMLEPGLPIQLDVYGPLEKNPEYAARLRHLALGDARIRLRGGYSRADLADILADIDVVVVPSLWYENAPLVISEAFAAGRPAIATNLGGMSEVVRDGINGLLFEKGSSAGLADALRRLSTEPGLLAHLRSGIEPVRTVEAEVESLLAIYRGVHAPVLV